MPLTEKPENPENEHRIVLSWLIRLRWLAAAGQVVAIGLAIWLLGLRYPLWPLSAVIGLTLLTNVGLVIWLGRRWMVPGWLVPAVIVLDVFLLTVLLYYTGGPDNPFVVLYAVHVAMATLVLGTRWAWATVAMVVACYAVLSLVQHPLTPADGPDLPGWSRQFGQAAALLLVVVLLAYFIGRLATLLRRRELELAAVREQAQINERLAALTTLAAGAAHELGTPLGTIAVVAKEMELAAREREEDALATTLAEDAALVRAQVERCREILEHLRGDVAGRGSDEPGTCDPAEVVQQVADQLHLDRRQRLEIFQAEPLPRMAAPPRAAQQALQFLVNNAFDASPENRAVSLRIGREEGRVRFEIIDRGTGMDADTLRRASEPFFTTKDPGRGMGLGLFLVRLVAERNGGRLMLESTLAAGTRAVFELPSVPE